MMKFLRRNQKKVFLVVVIVMFMSFAFLGTQSTVSDREVEDKKIGKTVDGSPIYERDIRALMRLLSIGSSDILRTDLLETGVFSSIAEKYFGEIEGDVQERLQKARTATFYSHPQAPFLNAYEVWNRFCPQLTVHLKEVQTGSCNAKTFLTYAKLYLDQQAFPPEMLRTILMYEQQNYSWMTPDYQLRDTRYLSLFGYQTFEEWFGSRFSDLLGKFILNIAALAKKKGYKVSQKEARADFLLMCYEAARMKALRKEVSVQDATEYMRSELLMAGVDESRAVELWRKVMLVHRFFQDIRQGVLLDPLPYQQFSSFADAKASVMVYQLPEVLRLKDFRSMLKVQYYLEAVSSKGRQSMVDLPRQFYSVEEVEKKHPQLVISRYELEVSKVSQDDIASRFGLRQMWDFETSDAGWTLLIAEFPILNKPGSNSAEEREKILDSCEEGFRKKIDRWARRAVLKTHPEWIQEALQERPPEKVVVEIRSRGAIAPFEDIVETSLLRETLQKAAIGEVVYVTSPNEETHYQVRVLQKPEKKEIMTLKQALENDWLGTLLDEKLEGAFAEARKKDSAIYKAADGSWKPLSQVRDHVGAYVYADLLKMLSPVSLSFEEYTSKRFEAFMIEAKKSIQKESDASKFLTATGHSLADQWILCTRHQEVKRCDTTALAKTEMFTKSVGSWSSVVTPPGGNVSFFHLIQRESPDSSIQEQVTMGQQLIGQDVTRQIIQTLLDEVGPL